MYLLLSGFFYKKPVGNLQLVIFFNQSTGSEYFKGSRSIKIFKV